MPNLVDERAYQFLLRRLDYLKQENEALKQQQSPTQVEKSVLAAAKAVAEITALYTKRDLKLKGQILVALKKTEKIEILRQHLLDTPDLLSCRDSTNGNTLLHVCASAGNQLGCQLLVEGYNFDLFATDLFGRTPLHLAAYSQHLSCCDYLTMKMEETCEVRGMSAPVDMAGLTPAAMSALAMNPHHDYDPDTKTQYESNRKILRRKLHVLGDPCISPHPRSARAPNSIARFKKNAIYGHHKSKGWGIRMEDFVFVKSEAPLSIFSILDGHGGSLCAEKSSEFLDTIEAEVELNDPTELSQFAMNVYRSLEAWLSTLPQFQLRLTEVPSFGGEEKKYEYKCSDNSGTTCLTAFLTSKYVCVANVGDSRGILISKFSDKEDQQISRDQKLTREGEEVKDDMFEDQERSRIAVAGGFVVNSRIQAVEKNELGEKGDSLGMTRSIGDFWAKTNPNLLPEQQIISPLPEIWVDERNESYLLLLASDGIWDVMTNQQVGDFVRSRLRGDNFSEEVLTQIAFELCAHCLGTELESMDNMSVIIIDLASIGGKKQFDEGKKLLFSESPF